MSNRHCKWTRLRSSPGRRGARDDFELAERRVVMMVGGSKTHALIASKLVRALWARIDLDKWVVLGSDLAVDVGPGSLRYPDAIVDSIGGQASIDRHRAGSHRRSCLAIIGDARSRRQGRGVFAASEPRRVPRSRSGRGQGLGLYPRLGTVYLLHR